MKTWLLLILLSPGMAFSSTAPISLMVRIESGKFKPFTGPQKKAGPKVEPLVSVRSFHMDERLVTNGDFLAFVKANPEWSKSQIKTLFADSTYLKSWSGDLGVKKADHERPVVFVSWFAASAFCESLGKDLPTTAEWEYTLADQGRDQAALQTKILAWYSKPNSKSLPKIDFKDRNGFGIAGLGTVVWEWTSDFNSFMLASDSRDSGGKDSNLFCGAGSQMGDPANYAAFMRYSFRASLKADYTTANLGFRCVKEEK